MLGTLISVLSFHLIYLMKPILQFHFTEESKARRSRNGASASVVRQPTVAHSVFGALAHCC